MNLTPACTYTLTAPDNADNGLAVITAALAAVLAIFAVTAASPIPAVATLAAVGFVGFATVPGLQTRVMEAAGSAGTLASAANIAAFNLGNAAGAWLGGVAIAAGFGLTSPDMVGAIMAAAGLAVALVAVGLDRRHNAAPGMPA